MFKKKDKVENKSLDKGNNFFYNNLKKLSILISLMICYILVDIGNYFNDISNFYIDIRNLLVAILVGILFSFLFTIQSIREFILKSVSNFMTDNSYIKKLSPNELKKLKDNVIKQIHGVDIVSNKESLFNHLESLDRFHSTPHKSIVNEKWIFDNIDDKPNFFKLTRIQDFRIHTLDEDAHKEFELIIKSVIHADETNKKDIEDSLDYCVLINGKKPVIAKVDSPENKIDIDYNQEKKLLTAKFVYMIPLEKEFTKVHIRTTRIEEVEFSQAIYSTHAAYGLNYDITLPIGYKYDDVYHSNTLDLKEENVSVHKQDRELSVNVNGWQLPGLIFVFTYSKVDNAHKNG